MLGKKNLNGYILLLTKVFCVYTNLLLTESQMHVVMPSLMICVIIVYIYLFCILPLKLYTNFTNPGTTKEAKQTNFF